MQKVLKILCIILIIFVILTIVGQILAYTNTQFLIDFYEEFTNQLIIDPTLFFKKLRKLLWIAIASEVGALILIIVLKKILSNSENAQPDEVELVEQRSVKQLKEEDIMSRKERAEKREAKKAVKEEKKVEKKVEVEVKEEKTEIKVAPTQNVSIKVDSNKGSNSASDFLAQLRNRRR